MSEDRQEWDAYVARVCAALGLDPGLVPIDEVLDLTRVIAHGGMRPMAPVSAYILALAAAGRPDADVVELRRTLAEAADLPRA